ncbi:iron complex transport system permease protein [Hypnocyclicus thermotrophus]|uniref:Iron complex transport system permease protein n=1 Tax=Hypnocyclicus thermotrophus TaxID=1627895 RepID=A0AA46E040_9FUSO|nr:iron ABC transporter permease [Hypnocyclicus thermotrophus]TDT72227.1 iron complex transport system permease protein [Hypnocyclicus thermotrophus]
MKKNIFINKKSYLYIIITLIILFVSIFVSLNLGNSDISIKEVTEILLKKSDDKIKTLIIWNIRLPRILSAILIGGSLAISGAGLQSIFRNPMVDPYIIGTSSGAAIGATLAYILKLDMIFIKIFAFIFALISSFFIYFLNNKNNQINTLKLLLSGIILNSFLSSIVSLLMILNKDELMNILYWTMGSLNSSSFKDLKIITFPIIIISFLFFLLHKELDIISFGEENARSVGVNSEKIKKYVLIFSIILTSISVSTAGIIGFVGLITPHFFRLFLGSNHKYILPLSFLGGGVFLLICDNISRSITKSMDIPLGIITGLFGAPLFLYLLLKSKK